MFYDSGSSLRGFENAQLDEMALSQFLHSLSRLVSSRLDSARHTQRCGCGCLLIIGRHDTQHNYIQHNDTQHKRANLGHPA
jgi:hypothetical protein